MPTDLEADPAWVVGTDGFSTIVDRLVADGRTVVAPVRRDGVVSPAPVTALDQTAGPAAIDQDAGRYRRLGDDGPWFGTGPTARPWKAIVHPEQVVTVRGRRDGNSVRLDEVVEPVARLAFVGIRACDLAGLTVLDRVLGASRPDPHYRAHRDDVVAVAMACTASAASCFCAAAGTGPSPSVGADVVVTELAAPGASPSSLFLVEPVTAGGRTLVADLPGSREAGADDRVAARAATDAAAAHQRRRLDPASTTTTVPAPDPDAAGWSTVAERCLACGNCTSVCPTCFCTRTDDLTDLSGTSFERQRRWDSCFTTQFSLIHGGPVRTSIASRYRQWLLHKLVTWPEQFDTPGCVGCGRCITWCPTGIDLTDSWTEVVS